MEGDMKGVMEGDMNDFSDTPSPGICFVLGLVNTTGFFISAQTDKTSWIPLFLRYAMMTEKNGSNCN